MYIQINKSNYKKHMDFLVQIEKTYYNDDWTGKEISIKQGGSEFVLYNHKEHGIIGGARISKLEEKHMLTEYFNQIDYMSECFLVIEEVFFHLPKDSSIHENENLFESLCVGFYKGLYSAMMLQGKPDQKITLITLNNLDDHEDIKHFGKWPFVMEHLISGEDEDSELVVGILPTITPLALSDLP